MGWSCKSSHRKGYGPRSTGSHTPQSSCEPSNKVLGSQLLPHDHMGQVALGIDITRVTLTNFRKGSLEVLGDSRKIWTAECKGWPWCLRKNNNRLKDHKPCPKSQVGFAPPSQLYYIFTPSLVVTKQFRTMFLCLRSVSNSTVTIPNKSHTMRFLHSPTNPTCLHRFRESKVIRQCKTSDLIWCSLCNLPFFCWGKTMPRPRPAAFSRTFSGAATSSAATGQLLVDEDLLKTGWWLVWTPLKNMKVNWDDYSQYMGK